MSSKAKVKQVLRHPLQRLQSPSRSASALLHTISLSSFAYSFIYLSITPNPINDSYGWHFQFLTILGLAITALAFLLGLLADLTLSPTLFRLKNGLAIAAAPLEILISVLYWGLRAIDPNLVLPKIAPRLNTTADLSFHVVPAVVLIIDLLFFSPPWAVGRAPVGALSSTIAVGYWFWVEQCYRYNKFYPYPIFDEVGFAGRIGLFVGSAVVMSLATFGLQSLYRMINGQDVDYRKKKL